MTPVRKLTFWVAISTATIGAVAALCCGEVLWWAIGMTFSTFLLLAGVKFTGV